MYLHLGQSVVIPDRDILGIFDLDNASWAFKTRELLERAEEEGRTIWLTEDLPRSFILADSRWGEPVVYIFTKRPQTTGPQATGPFIFKTGG